MTFFYLNKKIVYNKSLVETKTETTNLADDHIKL